MRSLFQKSLVPVGLVMTSLALGGNAMAATAQVKAKQMVAPRAFRPAVDVAAVPSYPNFSAADSASPKAHLGYGPAASAPYPFGFAPYGSAAGMRVDVAQLIGLLVGGSWPVHYGGKITALGSGGYDPTWDTPSPPVPIDNSAEDAAAAAAAAAAAQDANDSAALTASMAAAEQENDAANAATQQTLINNGM